MRAVLSVVALILAPTAASGAGPAEEIVYRVRINGLVCAGICPNFELRVRPDGQVRERMFRYDGVVRERIFTVSARAARDFRRELEPVRPGASRQFGAACDAKAPEGSAIPGISNYVVTWPGVQLRACFGDMPVMRATSLALLQLRIRPSDGARISAADARSQYACFARDERGFC